MQSRPDGGWSSRQPSSPRDERPALARRAAPRLPAAAGPQPSGLCCRAGGRNCTSASVADTRHAEARTTTRPRRVMSGVPLFQRGVEPGSVTGITSSLDVGSGEPGEAGGRKYDARSKTREIWRLRWRDATTAGRFRNRAANSDAVSGRLRRRLAAAHTAAAASSVIDFVGTQPALAFAFALLRPGSRQQPGLVRVEHRRMDVRLPADAARVAEHTGNSLDRGDDVLLRLRARRSRA